MVSALAISNKSDVTKNTNLERLVTYHQTNAIKPKGCSIGTNCELKVHLFQEQISEHYLTIRGKIPFSGHPVFV